MQKAGYTYWKRFNLKRLIERVLNIHDTYTVNSWINRLLALGIIEPNPHIQLSARKKVIKPSNDTRYILNKDEIERYAHTPS
jgi:predicted transcriptional regulator